MSKKKAYFARLRTRAFANRSRCAAFAALFLLAIPISAESRPWRIAALAGIPSGIGLGAEYAPPVRVSVVRPAFELHVGTYPRLTFTGSDADVTIDRSLGVGASAIAYFRDSRDGPFVALGYDATWLRLDADIRDDDSLNPVPYAVSGDFLWQSAEARIGWRWIVRRLTVSAEGGYGIAFFDGDIPATVSSGDREAIKETTLWWNDSSSRTAGWVARLGLGVAL
jgi:hypothetical protein